MKNIQIRAEVPADYIEWLATRILSAEDFDHRAFSIWAAETLEKLAAAIRKGYEEEQRT